MYVVEDMTLKVLCDTHHFDSLLYTYICVSVYITEGGHAEHALVARVQDG